MNPVGPEPMRNSRSRGIGLVFPFALAVALMLAACGRPSADAGSEETPGQQRQGPDAGTSGAPAEAAVVNVYNWTDYIDPEVLARFSRETGIKVNYDTFVSNEILETKLLSGRSGYDVVVITATFMENQLRAGVYQPLDAAQLPNLRNLDPVLDAQFAPGGAQVRASPRYSVPYHWGVTAMGLDAKKILARMPEAPLESWSMLFDPAIVARFADCGVAFVDSPVDAVGAVLAWLGRDPNSETDEDLARAEKALLAIRPYVRYVNTAAYGGDLTNGEICLALGFSGEVLRARSRARESGLGADIRLSIPREGAVVFSDGLAIVADAPHPGMRTGSSTSSCVPTSRHSSAAT